VPSEHVTAVCQQILTQGAVDDITIQDVPLEDIISEIFSRGAKRG
jgi:ABC-2 type transport system ATP-binding protein